MDKQILIHSYNKMLCYLYKQEINYQTSKWKSLQQILLSKRSKSEKVTVYDSSYITF